MSVLLTVARREFASLFRLPVGWIVIALYLLLTGGVFAVAILNPGQPATLRPFFALSGWLMLPVVPAVSMRLFSEEMRAGTVEPLLASPVADGVLVLGKFLGAAMFLVVMILPTLAFPITLALVASPAPDPGPVIAGYLSTVLLGTLALAVGTLASACTSSQTLAFLSTLFVLLGALLVSTIPERSMPPGVAGLVGRLALQPRMADFAKGVIDTAHVVWFLSLSGWLLVLATLALQSRRWR